MDTNHGNCNYMVYFLDLWASSVPVLYIVQHLEAFHTTYKHTNMASNIWSVQYSKQSPCGSVCVFKKKN